MLLRPGYRTNRSTQRGLVGWWPFDDGGVSGTTPDASGHPQNAGIFNAGASRSGNGIARPINAFSKGALGLVAASSQYLDCGVNSSLNPAEITVAMWINTTSFVNEYAALAARVITGNDSFTFHQRTTGKLALYVAVGGTFANIDPCATAIPSGVWTHVAFTYNTVLGMVVYVNAVSDGTIASTGALTSGSANLYIGQQSGQTRFYNGFIDDVRVYNRALAAIEILAIYREPFQPWLDIETIALMQTQVAAVIPGIDGGTSNPIFRVRQPRSLIY